MLRRALLLAACLTAPALAAPSEPSPAQIRHLAQACSAEDAFGMPFGQKLPASAPRPAGAEWAPVQVLTVRLAAGQLAEVDGTASFAKALMSNEDRIALARWVFRAVDAEIQSRHRFVRRDVHPGAVTYAAPGFSFALSHDGVVLRLACAEAKPPA